MKVIQADLEGVLIIEPDVFDDDRGCFFESWQLKRYREHGIKEDFVQDNVSFSAKNVLRGLHFQHPHEQGKLVQALKGEVFDVAVDIRFGSPGFRKWFGTRLSEENRRQMYVPPGFAHGFVVLSDEAIFSYKCTDFYSPGDDRTILFSDPEIGIEWPVKNPLLSDKDAAAPLLAGMDESLLPVFDPVNGCTSA